MNLRYTSFKLYRKKIKLIKTIVNSLSTVPTITKTGFVEINTEIAVLDVKIFWLYTLWLPL